MLLSWNQIRTNATAFAKRFAQASKESAESQTFWNEFFGVFGIDRKQVGVFELSVDKLGDKKGSIDLFWEGKLLVEHKSKGKDLIRARNQALGYIHGLKQEQLPSHILISDFENFHLYDLETGKTHLFKLPQLRDKVELFTFLTERTESVNYEELDPVNTEAAAEMGALHDKLEEFGYRGHQLEIYLVRLLFCLFADNTGIFERRGMFNRYLKDRTRDDGSDLGAQLVSLFDTLDKRHEERMRNLDEDLKAFPYVNGSLFAEMLPVAAFDSQLRNILINAGRLDWSKISPAIFGSLFQSAMDKEERRNLGAHYTSEKNILRLIEPLFLDELYEEFNQAKTAKSLRQLHALHEKIGTLKFLDPACGCGNFLIITYRELRQLEIEIIHEMKRNGEEITSIREYLKVTIDQFYGIEYDEFAARIAEVAMWLMEHQMNLLASDEFGEYILHLPLDTSATIRHGNALRFDWAELVAPEDLDYILGNPPFIGHHYQNKEQKEEIRDVLKKIKGAGVMDYVASWFYKSAKFIQGTAIKCALVSTNSISQGEQASLLWDTLLNTFGVTINFAHQTFKWSNEAKGVAAVHVIIIGFAQVASPKKYIFEYEHITSEPERREVHNISPYLIEASNTLILNRRDPISEVPRMVWGNKPTDGGHLLFKNKKEVERFLDEEPDAAPWIRPYISGRDLINNGFRYCLWLVDITPNALRRLPKVMGRLEAVRKFRLASKAVTTRERAATPTLFVQIAQPDSDYLAVPEVSSERRDYIPIAYFSADVIASNTIQIVPEATPFHFGMLTSRMHMVWMSVVCGRLESRYRYSNSLVYNNYPFPENVSDKQRTAVEQAAQAVLDTRKPYLDKGDSLADLYDPLTMPADLRKAHQKLDKAVDRCYRAQPFKDERERIEFLFQEYEKRVKS